MKLVDNRYNAWEARLGATLTPDGLPSTGSDWCALITLLGTVLPTRPTALEQNDQWRGQRENRTNSYQNKNDQVQ